MLNYQRVLNLTFSHTLASHPNGRWISRSTSAGLRAPAGRSSSWSGTTGTGKPGAWLGSMAFTSWMLGPFGTIPGVPSVYMAYKIWLKYIWFINAYGLYMVGLYMAYMYIYIWFINVYKPFRIPGVHKRHVFLVETKMFGRVHASS